MPITTLYYRRRAYQMFVALWPDDVEPPMPTDVEAVAEYLEWLDTL